MARRAPATERTIAIVEFLASEPERPFSLSELARRLGLNKATAHAVLGALVDAGWLLRHPVDKTYTLGPALVGIGTAAAGRHRTMVEFAEPEMHRLSEELGLQCFASAVVGEEILILARVGATTPLGVTVPVGQRLPLVPPLGTVFMAWAPEAEIDAWLHRLGPSATAADLEC
ncbi:MAG: IclR family transcriptional regulator, partial [Acidimicrobiia bacterium]